MISYKIVVTERFEETYRKLDKTVQFLIRKWITSHLMNTDEPTSYGKPLLGNLKGYWRYRIGDYRLIVEIRKEELVLIMINIGHCSNIYEEKR